MSTSPQGPHAPFNAPDADITIISSDDVQFKAHMPVLSNASPVFEDMFTLPSSASTIDEPGHDNLPLVHVSEDSRVIEQLLSFCYPSLHGSVQDLQLLRQLFAAAEKYEMKGVTSQLAYILRWQFVEKEPHRVYALACMYGLPDVAKVAGKHTLLHTHPGPFLAEFEEMPASAYHRLFVYRQKCIDVIHPLLDDWHYKVWGMREDVTWTMCAECRKPVGSSTPYWFLDHLERTKAAFVAKPHGGSVTSTKLIQETIAKHLPVTVTAPVPINTTPVHSQCLCRVRAPSRLLEFNEKLAAVLDQKIADIPFPLK